MKVDLRRYSYVGLAVALTAAAVLFQNCGSGGFKSPGVNPLGANTPPPPTSTAPTSRAQMKGKELFTSLPFIVGTTHWSGKYAFQNTNYFAEGLGVGSELGAPAIFVTLDPSYKTNYGTTGWGTAQSTSLKELVSDSTVESALKSNKLTMVLLNAFSFSVGTQIMDLDASAMPDWELREENEFYELTKHLYQRYKESGKVFVIKNWESDWFVQQGYNIDYDLTDNARIQRITNWLKARHRGVKRARDESADTKGIIVLFAVEFNIARRSMPVAQGGQGRRTIINQVIPQVAADLATWSAYEVTNEGSAQEIENAANYALSMIPDPMGLSKRRLLMSEFGLYEKGRTAAAITATWNNTFTAAKNAGLSGIFVWQIFDASCNQRGTQIPLIENFVALNNPLRPTTEDCSGNSLKKPDGSLSPVVPLMQSHWFSNRIEMPNFN